MTMQARHSAECAADCGVRIEPADLIRHVDPAEDTEAAWTGWAHVVCPQPRGEEVDTSNVCPDCHEVRAKNGACSC